MSKVYLAVSGFAGSWSEYITNVGQGFVDQPNQPASWMRRFHMVRQQADRLTPDGIITWTLHPATEGSMIRMNWRNAAIRADQIASLAGQPQTRLGDFTNLLEGCLWWQQNARGLTHDLYMGVPDLEQLGLLVGDSAYAKAFVASNMHGFNLISRKVYVDSLESINYPAPNSIPVGPPIMRALRANGFRQLGVEPLPYSIWDQPPHRGLVSNGLITRALWQVIRRDARMQTLDERVIFYSNSQYHTYEDMIEQLQAGHSIAVLNWRITDLNAWREVLAARRVTT